MRKISLLLIILSMIFNLGCVSESMGYDQIQTKNTNQEEIIKELTVHYINVGQADSIFIDYGDYDILIDGGNNSDGQLVVDYLKQLNTDDIELIIGTHNHEDHIGGLDTVINNFDVENIITTENIENIDLEQANLSDTYKDYIRVAKNEKDTIGCKLIEDSDLTFNLDDNIQFKILEMGDNFGDENNNSIVTMLDYNDIEFLFMGDLESNIEKQNLTKFSDIDVLKLGHHGSKTSSDRRFLDIVKPEYGIISCGIDNSYGHPNTETVAKLKEYNIKTFRTDTQGTIIAKTDGKSVSFNVEPMDLNVDNINGNDTNANMNTTNNTVNNNTNPTTEIKSKTVYITNTGKKYHNDRCRYLNDSKIPISLDEAIKQGYTPCGVCKP